VHTGYSGISHPEFTREGAGTGKIIASRGI
jgi:hypothetical protein